jgi:hypothetical protein
MQVRVATVVPRSFKAVEGEGATFAALRAHHGEQTLTSALHAKGKVIGVEMMVWQVKEEASPMLGID